LNKGFDDFNADLHNKYAAQSAKNGSGGVSKNSTTVNQKVTVNMQQVPGHDHDACWKHGVKQLTHVANGASGNSVNRPISQLGNHRQ